ncbi:hypothetical protein FF011L_07480 [Roseimaritima multifibrata]|uniref:Uncharacterized protein n=1 Tax=Roseimaritima multifibrata TaxID=1930274 RepID=A0A517MAU7_9BACT|nr:hypothetical protein FF011L_07480 [Roseimaritima multifibrata]
MTRSVLDSTGCPSLTGSHAGEEVPAYGLAPNAIDSFSGTARTVLQSHKKHKEFSGRLTSVGKKIRPQMSKQLEFGLPRRKHTGTILPVRMLA